MNESDAVGAGVRLFGGLVAGLRSGDHPRLGGPVTDLIDRPADLDDDWFERPTVTRLPPRPPVHVVAPLSATVRYPTTRVPDLQDAPPVAAPAPRPQFVWIRSRVT